MNLLYIFIVCKLVWTGLGKGDSWNLYLKLMLIFRVDGDKGIEIERVFQIYKRFVCCINIKYPRCLVSCPFIEPLEGHYYDYSTTRCLLSCSA